MSLFIHAQCEANQHASLSNKFVLCHLSARYYNIGYSFSSMHDCSLKTTQFGCFHPAFLCPHRKLFVRFSILVKMVVSKCVVQKLCMAHFNENTVSQHCFFFFFGEGYLLILKDFLGSHFCSTEQRQRCV